MDLKSSSITLGTMPASLPKIANAKPAAPVVDAPRDSGGMADGKTGGNFRPYTRPNSGAGIADAGAEAAQAQLAENLK